MDKLKFLQYTCMVFCLWFPASEVFGCSCATQEKPLETYVKENGFIAYVKIIRVEILSAEEQKRISEYEGIGQAARLVYQVKEIFKGDSATVLYAGSINTSCDMDISPGSEWIFFTNKNKRGASFTGFCNKWFFMREADGKQTFGYDYGMDAMRNMRKILHLKNDAKLNGNKLNYYITGEKESLTRYKKGLMDGERTLYYRNGTIRGKARFRKGLKEGEEKEFTVNSQLISSCLYVKNTRVQRKEWYDTFMVERRRNMIFEMDHLPHKNESVDEMLKLYPHGVQLKSESYEDPVLRKDSIRTYNWNGSLESCAIYDANNGIHRKYEYHPNGKIALEIVSRISDRWEEEKKWNADGKLISHKIWSKNKYLGEQLPQENQ